MQRTAPCQRFRKLTLILFAGTLCMPVAAVAQNSPSSDQVAAALQRLQALERQIEAKQAELEAYRAELRTLRRQLAPAQVASSDQPGVAPPEQGQPAAEAEPASGICSMANAEDLNQALLIPSALSECVRPPEGTTEPALARAARQAERERVSDIDNPAPDRPRIAPGISTTLEFANRGRASVTYTHPVHYRSVVYEEIPRGRFGRGPQLTDRFIEFRPQLMTISAGLNVPIVKDVSNFVSVERREDRSDIDVLSGTTLRLGFDFFSFRTLDREQSLTRLVQFLWRARAACARDRGIQAGNETAFFARYGLRRRLAHRDDWTSEGAVVQPANGDRCSGADLIGYVLELEHDGQGGSRFKRAPFATEYQAAFWEEPRTAIPRWGFGASIEYGTTDFKYRQGSLLIGPDMSDPPRITLSLDRTMPLAESQTDTEDDWKIQVYGAFFIPFPHADRPPIGRPHNPGVMLVGSATYLSAHQFRTGAGDVSFCPPVAAGALSTGCTTINIDRPYIRDGITLSGELRTQFFNVPVIRVLGFAPRYGHRLADGRQELDLPVYLSPNTDGWGSAGIRYRRQWDGIDLLGNPEPTRSEISVFLTGAINFRGY